MDMQKAPVYAMIASIIGIVIIVIAYLYYSLYCYKLQAINAGLEDEILIKEYGSTTGKNTVIADMISVIITVVMLIFFVVSIYAGQSGNYFPISGLGTFQVVASGSMSYINDSNTYLTENGLENQFDTYDIIAVNPVPEENRLKIYDVIVYKNKDRLIVHRIIDIEEINGVQYYTMRGDANSFDDDKPITYNDMIGIYTGFKIPMMGIFVIFLQSALGYIAMGLIFLMETGSIYFEKKLDKAAKERLNIIGITIAK